MDALVSEAGSREEGVQVLDVFGGTSCFFAQLASGANFGILVAIELARRDLVNELVCRVAILLDEQDLRIIRVRIAEKRHDRAGSGMP